MIAKQFCLLANLRIAVSLVRLLSVKKFLVFKYRM